MKFRPKFPPPPPNSSKFLRFRIVEKVPSFRDASIFREGKTCARIYQRKLSSSAIRCFFIRALLPFLLLLFRIREKFAHNLYLVYQVPWFSFIGTVKRRYDRARLAIIRICLARCRDNRSCVTFGVVTGQANTATTCNPTSTPSNSLWFTR